MDDNKSYHTVRGYEILKKDKKKLTPSMEDYVEMIYRSCQKNGYSRVNYIAERLNVKAPSVSKVLQKLSKIGYIHYEKYGIIQLTDKGKEAGKYLLDRHITVETFLKNIGTQDTAFVDTELIEHHLSPDTLKNIEALNEFLSANPDVVERLFQFRQSLHTE